jgi:flagellar hook-basal body complex protein FliE
MPVPPIDPSFSTTGPEWSVGSVGPVQDPAQGSGQASFGGMLSNAISGLDQSQTQAAGAAQSLATGTAKDPTSVVMQVEQASLAMQLASQIRTKAVEAENDIFHTQI